MRAWRTRSCEWRSVSVTLAALALCPAAGRGQEEAARQITLGEALEMARRASPALGQAGAGVDVAEQTRLSAYGAFLPSVDLSYGYINSSSGRLDPTGQAITTTSYTSQIGASYVLFDGLRRFRDLRGARLSVDAELARYRETEWDTAERVKGAYFNAVANRDLVRVEQDRVARQEEQLRFVEQQLALGRATRSDVLRSRVDLNNARVALVNARAAARNSRYALAEAVGVTSPLEPVEEAGLETEPLGLGRAELLGMALQAAPSLVAARAETQAAEAQVSSARSSYLPSLVFSGGWAWQNAEFPPRNRSWSLSLRGSYPLFDGLQRETALIRAGAQAERAGEAERATELSLRTQLDQALGQVEAAQASIELAEETVELASEDLRVTRERYRLGLATILDLQTAQIALQQAEVDLIRRRFDYRLGVARLETLLGAELQP